MKWALALVGLLVSTSTVAIGGTVQAEPAPASAQWTVSASYPPVAEYLEGVACTPTGASATCQAVGFAAGGASILSSSDGGQSWAALVPPPSVTELESVTCASASQCTAVGNSDVASGENGAVVTTTDGGAVWVARIVPAGVFDLTGVSCPSLDKCEAVGVSAMGDPVILSSTNGGVAWSEQTAPAGILELSAVSCSSPSVCDAVGTTTARAGLVIATTNGGGAWAAEATPTGATQYNGIDCVASSSTCVAVGVEYTLAHQGYPVGFAASTTNGGANWTAGTLPAGVAQLDDVSCATTAICELTGVSDLDAGLALGTTNGGASWSAETLPTGVSGLPGVACPSTSDCAAVGFSHTTNYTAALVSTINGGGSWSAEAAPPAVSDLSAVSCAGPNDCMAVGYQAPDQGVVVTTGNGAESWSTQDLPAGVSDLYGIACPEAGDCVAVGDSPDGAAIVGTADAGAVWTSEALPSGAYVLGAVACPGGTNACVAVGYTTPPTGPSSGVVLTTTDGGAAWSMQTAPAAVTALYGVACAQSVTDCEAVGTAGTAAAIIGTTDGSTWTAQAPPAGVSVLRGVACPAAGTCSAVGWSAGTSAYTGAIIATTDGGDSWAASAVPAKVAQLTSVSCVSVTSCEAVGEQTSGSVAVVATTDGTTWAAQAAPAGGATLAGVSCAAATTELCVGSGAEVPGGAVLLAYTAAPADGTSFAHAAKRTAATAAANTTTAHPASSTASPGVLGQAATPDADWPAYLDGGEHSSYNAAATTITPADLSTLHVAWRWLPPASPNAGYPFSETSPTVSDGVVYTGEGDGYLYAISETTHETLWSQFLGLDFSTGTCGTGAQGLTSTATVAPNPATGQETVYDNGSNGWLYAVDAVTGALEWKALVDVPGRGRNDYYSWGSPLVANGRVYVGVSSDCDGPLVPAGLVSFNASTGGQLAWWDSVPAGQIGASVWSSPAVAPNGDIFTDTGNAPASVQPLYNESIVRLDPNTLQVLDAWQVPLVDRIGDGDFGGSPTLFTADIDGTETPMVAACNKNGYLYAFAQDDLSAGPVWSALIAENSTAGTECDAAPTWNGTDLIEGGGGLATINGKDYPGSVQALDPATGAVLWETGVVAGPIIGSTAEDAGGVVTAPVFYQVGATPGVELLNGATGALLGKIQTGGQEFGQGVFAGDDLFVSCFASTYGLAAYQVTTSGGSPGN